MADDDQLRLRATVVPDWKGPLADLRNDLLRTGNIKTGRTVQKDWEGVGKAVGGVVRQLNEGLAPAFRGISVGSLGVTGAVGAMAMGMKNVASQGRNLKFLSDQLDMSVNALREIEELGKHFNIPTEQTEASLKTFADNMNQIKRRWGAAYNELRAMNLGNIAEDLINAPSLEAAFGKVLEDLKKIPDPVYRRKIASLLLGTDMLAVVATEMTPNLLERIRKEVGRFSKKDIERSEQVVGQLKAFNREWDALLLNLGAGLPVMNSALRALNTLIDGIAHPGKTATEREKEFGNALKTEPGSRADRLRRAEERLKEVDKKLSVWFGGHMAFGDSDSLAERQALLKEIEKLKQAIDGGAPAQNKNIEDGARKGASEGIQDGLKKMMFTGPLSFSGARVMQASYGGGGFAAPGRNFAAGGGMPGPLAGGGPSGLSTSRRQTAAVAADAWRRAGMSAHGVAGILYNIQQESNFNPTLRHPDQPRWSGEAHYAHGLYQEGGAEWNNYAAWLKKNYPNADWRDPKLQSEYAALNLQKNYPGVWRAMKHARSPEEAAAAYARGYLKPRADYLAQRLGRIRRGIPGAEHYTGDTPPAADAVPLPRARPQTIEGRASLDIHLHGLPAAARTRTQIDGMFREVRLTRSNRQSATSSDYVA